MESIKLRISHTEIRLGMDNVIAHQDSTDVNTWIEYKSSAKETPTKHASKSVTGNHNMDLNQRMHQGPTYDDI